jgi:hypothetical protein
LKTYSLQCKWRETVEAYSSRHYYGTLAHGGIGNQFIALMMDKVDMVTDDFSFVPKIKYGNKSTQSSPYLLITPKHSNDVFLGIWCPAPVTRMEIVYEPVDPLQVCIYPGSGKNVLNYLGGWIRTAIPLRLSHQFKLKLYLDTSMNDWHKAMNQFPVTVRYGMLRNYESTLIAQNKYWETCRQLLPCSENYTDFTQVFMECRERNGVKLLQVVVNGDVL